MERLQAGIREGIWVPIGDLFVSPWARGAIEGADVTPAALLARHQSGDWGAVDADEKKRNEKAMSNGGRICSHYILASGERVWVVTDLARWETNIVLAAEHEDA